MVLEGATEDNATLSWLVITGLLWPTDSNSTLCGATNDSLAPSLIVVSSPVVIVSSDDIVTPAIITEMNEERVNYNVGVANHLILVLMQHWYLLYLAKY